ncbi:MFS transporter [Variovorax sp. J22R115]|uniref:MFS transporter n=1 Tax=Variovorax sp. J22R115 TaxID=3053509 RepID=UPI002578F9AD|nr:MFS transporter [Variovorax sp. J22R115]MDM0050611.1 MFS transporter [Variovorax sp. J22R115]
MKSVGLFRGWYIVGAAHVLLALIFGAAYSFGAFFSLPSSLTLFLGAFCVLVGLGVGLVYVPVLSTIQRWFVLHRSLASGIALAGTGVGTLVGPMVAGAVMRHLSWQSTMQVYALAIALLGLIAAAGLWGGGRRTLGCTRMASFRAGARGLRVGRCCMASAWEGRPGRRASGGCRPHKTHPVWIYKRLHLGNSVQERQVLNGCADRSVRRRRQADTHAANPSGSDRHKRAPSNHKPTWG